MWLSSRLVMRLSRGRPVWLLIAIGGAQLCAAYTIVAADVSVATVTVSSLVLGGGYSFIHSSLQTWATSVVPEARGTTVAFFASSLFVGGAVASWAAGPLAENGAYPLLFGLTAAVAVPLTVVADAQQAPLRPTPSGRCERPAPVTRPPTRPARDRAQRQRRAAGEHRAQPAGQRRDRQQLQDRPHRAGNFDSGNTTPPAPSSTR